jgi:hypothetical protein
MSSKQSRGTFWKIASMTGPPTPSHLKKLKEKHGGKQLKGSSETNIPKIKDTLDWKGTTPKRKVEETKKKTNNLKIKPQQSQTKTKTKKGSGGTNLSGAGDTNL